MASAPGRRCCSCATAATSASSKVSATGPNCSAKSRPCWPGPSAARRPWASPYAATLPTAPATERSAMKPFPIPVVGPGSHEVEEAANYLPMPHDMAVFRAPVLEPSSAQAAAAAHAVLSRLLADMRGHRFGAGEAPGLDLGQLAGDALDAVNQALGH